MAAQHRLLPLLVVRAGGRCVGGDAWVTIKTHPASCCTTQLGPAQPSSCYRLPGLQNLHLLVVAGAAARAGVAPAPAPGWVSTLLSPHTCSDRVSCGQLPVLPLRTPQHCNNTALILTQAVQQCVPAWCVCVMLAGGRCVSASAHHRDIAHRDLLSTELSWALVRWRAWVRGAQAAGPVSSPPTLHTPAPTSHQPPAETGRKSGDLWKWPVF